MKQAFSKTLPRDVSLGVLLIALLASVFFVVIPTIRAIKAGPGTYINSLPVASQGLDIDRDGVANNVDATPFGSPAQHAVATEPVVESAQ